MSAVPEIETARLLLRGWRDADTDAWAELCADDLISLIADDNHRSQRVAEKLGMEVEGRAQVRGHDLRMYGVDL